MTKNVIILSKEDMKSSQMKLKELMDKDERFKKEMEAADNFLKKAQRVKKK